MLSKNELLLERDGVFNIKSAQIVATEKSMLVFQDVINVIQSSVTVVLMSNLILFLFLLQLRIVQDVVVQIYVV